MSLQYSEKEAAAFLKQAGQGQRLPKKPETSPGIVRGAQDYLEKSWDWYWSEFGLSCYEFEAEVSFALCIGRNHKFDRAIIAAKLYVELDGKVHMNFKRWRGDMQKFNDATDLGWRGYHFSAEMLESDPIGCVERVNRALMAEKLVRR